MWLSHKSVWVRTSSVSSISCLGMKGNKISCSFLVFCHFPRVLPRELDLVRYIIRHCLPPTLGKSSTELPCFSQAPSSSASSNMDWMDLGFPPNQRVYFRLLQLFDMTMSLKQRFKSLRLPGWNWRGKGETCLKSCNTKLIPKKMILKKMSK